MTRKVLVLALVIVMCVCGCSCAAKRTHTKAQPVYKGRNIPSDPSLPQYDNPSEVDVSDGKLHLSFKGAFRSVDDNGYPTNWVYFAFVALAQEDMSLTVAQSELYDSKAKIYRYHSVPKIGDEHTFKRELIAGVRVPVLVGVNMSLTEAGEFPSVSRITITFNKESFAFRNIQTEEWYTWEELQEGM